MWGGEGVGLELPSAVPHGLAHAPFHHQSREGGVYNGPKWRQVHNLYLSLAVLCEHLQLKGTSLGDQGRRRGEAKTGEERPGVEGTEGGGDGQQMQAGG